MTPPRGFGRWMNPCIDCHLLMLREAGRIMAREGYDFLFTGEVVGQRPFSQNKGSLNYIARESGYGDLLLRPLSAKLLKTTRPEREGLVDRERLLNISGRGRKRQMELAAQYRDYVVSGAGRRLPAHQPGLLIPFARPGTAPAPGRSDPPGPGPVEMGAAFPGQPDHENYCGPGSAGQ